MSTIELTTEIDKLLPQTQCTQCDYPRCLDYAKAIASGEADINQCPPGGDTTIAALAKLLKLPEKPLNPLNGQIEPRLVAVIDESACIGCRLCIKACPVDCIVGAGKVMHTVINHDCTGCKLCVPVCPTDCIDLHAANVAPGKPSLWPAFTQQQVAYARDMTEQRLQRIAQRDAQKKQQKSIRRRQELQNEIQAALARKQDQ